MTYDITTRKGSSGWEAASEAVLGEADGGLRVLKLITAKSGTMLSATASVCIRHDRGGYFSETHAIFADFYKSGIAAQPCTRATEKALLEVHSRALIQMDALIAEATAQYANKAEAA